MIAARRAPRRPRTRPFTWSRCSSAPLRPREVAIPSDSICDNGVEVGSVQIAIRIGAPHQREQIVFVPILGGGFRHDLLRQDVERVLAGSQSARVRPIGSRE